MPEEKLNVFSGKHRKQLQDALTEFFDVSCNLFLEAGDFSEESPNQIIEVEKKIELKMLKKKLKMTLILKA